jgi:NAD(P)-dependent dehydrogenase (short-subunit alcohol dehydrogenase family)
VSRVVIVTGASRGIGLATARRFLAAGDEVIAVARPSGALRDATKTIQHEGFSWVVVEADVGNPRAIRQAVALAAGLGPIEVLVNNAAAQILVSVEELPVSEWNAIVNTNLTAPFLLTKAVVPHMKDNGKGSIVNIASVGALFGPPQAAAYGATKAALVNFSQALAAELIPHSIRVNVVSPGMTHTDMGRSVTRSYRETAGLPEDEFISSLQGRWIDPAEIAEIVFWLSSPEASGVSGAHVVADLGKTTRLATPPDLEPRPPQRRRHSGAG